MTTVSIHVLDDAGRARWDEFVRSSPVGTFFHLSAWKDVVAAEFTCRCHYLYAERDGAIVGVLPLGHVRNLIAGNVLMSMPFLVYGGPIGDAESVQALAEEASRLGRELGVDYVELRNRDAIAGDWITKSAYVTFRKSISHDPEVNLKAVPRKQRAVIRKGDTAGLDVSWKVDLDLFYEVFSESYHNLGTPVFGKSLFQRLYQAFDKDIWLTTLTKSGRPVASVLSFVFRDEVLPYYGGGTSAARDLNANDYMYWLVMKRAALEGFKVFDYGRSKVDSGSYRFKKHWGFEPTPLAYQVQLVRAEEVPNLSPTNPAFQRPIEMWKRLPLAVTRVLGPPIARRLA